MPSTWKLLEGYEVPLLIRFDFGSKDYSLQLTDLTHIWIEHLDRKPIIQRAFDIDASIDPSEDISQMRLLLSSIQNCLDREPNTQMHISSNDNGEHIVMRLSASMPAPSPELQWQCKLSRRSPATFSQNLIVPLLASRLEFQTEITSLVSQVKEKDHVIAKLVGQMQAGGSDFSKVFPGNVGQRLDGKSNVRQVLGKSVKGMAEFDEEAWRARKHQDTAMPWDLKSILCKVTPMDTMEPWSVPEDNAWWGTPHQVLFNKTDLMAQRKQRYQVPEEDTGVQPSEDQEFQRQSTPPKAGQLMQKNEPPTKHKISEIAKADMDDSTTYDSNDDLSASPARQNPTSPDSAAQSKDTQRENPTRADAALKAHPTTEAGASNISSPRQPGVRSASGEPFSAKGVVRDAKPKLGKIGGKKFGNAPSPEDDKPKLGKIGRKKSQQPQSPGTTGASSKGSSGRFLLDVASRGRQNPSTEDVSPPRETSQERANRNREKLKRDLASKAQAGHKKKRKF